MVNPRADIWANLNSGNIEIHPGLSLFVFHSLLVFLAVLIFISSSRNGSRSPRPSVLLPTKAWQAQQEQLGKYDQKRISPTEFDDSDKPKLKYDEFIRTKS